MNRNGEEEEDFSKLPLEDRLIHKSWKARLNGYQELLKHFQSAFPLQPQLTRYWSDPTLFNKYILDNNVVAQENALFAFHEMLVKQIPSINDLNKFPIETYLNDWLPPLLNKALNSSRSKSKDLVVTCVLKLFSLDVSIKRGLTLIINEILPKIRIPKLIFAVISLMDTILQTFRFINIEFGSSEWVELLNLIYAPFPKLASHADKNVRGSTMNLIVTLYHLVGKDLSLLQEPLLDKLKPIQQRELNKKFEASSDELTVGTDCETGDKIQFEWQRREEMERQANGEVVDEDGDTNMDINVSLLPPQKKVDPLLLLPEENLLDNLPEEFYSRVKSSKWKDRVEVLEELNDTHLSKLKKLIGKSDYSPLIKVLSEIIHKDVNVQCVTLSADCVNKFLQKLSQEYIHEHYIAMIFPALLERTKERKPSVIEMIKNTIHTICDKFPPFIPENETLILGEILVKFHDKIPQVRLQCGTLVDELLGRPELIANKEYLSKNLIDGLKIFDGLKKLINDTQMNIRNVSFNIVAKMINLLGMGYFQEFLESIDKIKRKKIEQFVDGPEGQISLSAGVATMSTSSASNQRMKNAPQMKKSTLTIPQPSNNNNNNNNRLNKIIPNKRAATSPAINMKILNGSSPRKAGNGSSNVSTPQHQTSLSKSPLRTIRKNPLSSPHIDSINNHSNATNKLLKEENDKLRNQLKELETQNNAKQLQIKELEIKLNQHIQTIVTKDTEIQRLKRQYDVAMMTQSPRNERETGVNIKSNSLINNNNREAMDNNSKIRTDLRHRPTPLLNNTNKNVSNEINKSPSEDLPSKVRRLQLDPMRVSRSDQFTSNSTNSTKSLTRDPQEVINTTMATEESWQRAAQVTQQLKDRINRMRNRK